MKLQDLTLKEFLAKSASNEPLPGGGCSAAFFAATAAALIEMVANLTIGRKKYAAVEDRMKEIVQIMEAGRIQFLNDIDRDADAYRLVMDAYSLPKNNGEELALRNNKIEEAAKTASLVPMELAERVYSLLGIMHETLQKGNVNAVTDGKVGLLAAHTAIRAALLNVRVNLECINDEQFIAEMTEKCDNIEKSIF